jgi:two-component system response regulator FixJ
MIEQTVFIVDDDESVRTGLVRLFSEAGLRAKTFATAEEFLAALDPDQPGVLLLELISPAVAVPRMQEALGRRGAHLPIILCSSLADVSTATASLKAGALDFTETFRRTNTPEKRTRCAGTRS